jgi:putative nucleotidyltransferase with HDIG domain
VVSHTDLSLKGIPQPTYLVEMFHKDRSIRWLEITEVLVFDKGGKIVAVEGIACDITEKKMAEKRVKEEMEVTSHLLMIAEATADTTNLDKMLEEVVHCGHKIIHCDICLSYLWDGGAKVFKPSHAYGLKPGITPLFKTEFQDMKSDIIKTTMKKKKPIIISDDNASLSNLHSAFFSWIPNIKAISLIPLIGKEGYLGLIIGVYNNTVKTEERDIKIMNGIARQVSIALEDARLYRESLNKSIELSQKIETIQVMNEIDRSILSTLKSQEILETIIMMIARLIPCDRATIALVDKERQGFTYAAGFGVEFIPKGAFVLFRDTSATEVIKTGRLQYVSNLKNIKNLPPLEDRLLKNGFLSHIRIPIVAKNEIVGVLNLGSQRQSAFSPEDLSTLEKLAYQIGVALENSRLITDLEELFLGTVKSLSSAIDAKSKWTAGHSERVTRYALSMGKEMSFSENELKDLELGGLLHDIGKLGTYEAILDKPGRLTDEEFKLVKQHPMKGAEILSPIKQLRNIIPAVRNHHEFYNGKGYPDGLKEDEIPLMARIMCIADSVDAMGADRPYRKGKSMDEIVTELKRCSWTQFDPKVVDVFLKVAKKIK